ncbi:hypothetical protein CI238_09479 [Colletotrichum incanum]|uniref:Uncharacterized protein n=1 Tax=Colletotrichum incanum TaxID=1573173 RepID=A0A161VX24_COLIC|nr:hypothetical protein CI238_09479 [Colletotrichum incanum]
MVLHEVAEPPLAFGRGRERVEILSRMLGEGGVRGREEGEVPGRGRIEGLEETWRSSQRTCGSVEDFGERGQVSSGLDKVQERRHVRGSREDVGPFGLRGVRQRFPVCGVRHRSCPKGKDAQDAQDA